MLHTLSKRERTYGLIKSESLFGGYLPDHKFDAVKFKPLNSSPITKTEHNKGAFKMSGTGEPRVNGFTFLTKNKVTTIDICIINNIIYIDEL